ncbi:hypothetical protein EIP91_003286 [Steccherinum ochraceum]|uniref:Uncharacterized protein n=1 Tax=Steccherinum ochraceum TaxID=92696 RepID=A0A4R0RMI1_9APHY|nr:hypothetical protein EIP91_003286 [Steccherinum ochraceum]
MPASSEKTATVLATVFPSAYPRPIAGSPAPSQSSLSGWLALAGGYPRSHRSLSQLRFRHSLIDSESLGFLDAQLNSPGRRPTRRPHTPSRPATVLHVDTRMLALSSSPMTPFQSSASSASSRTCLPTPRFALSTRSLSIFRRAICSYVPSSTFAVTHTSLQRNQYQNLTANSSPP